MKLVLSKNKLLVFFTILIMLMPSIIADSSLFKLLNNAWIVVCIVIMLKKHYKFTKFSGLITAYFVFWLLSTIINHNVDSHIYIWILKTLIIILFIDCMFKNDYIKTIDSLWLAIMIFVCIDFLSIVFFPNGLYQTITEWNEWSSSNIAVWFLGNKNNRIAWYMIAMLLSYIKYLYKKDFSSKFIAVFVCIISIIAMLLVNSSTSIIIVVLMTAFELLSIFKKRIFTIRINPNIITIIYIIVEVLILLGFVNFLTPIVEGIFDKSLTFTGRSEAWSTVIPHIIDNLVLGSGYIPSTVASGVLGSAAFVNAHNQWLQTLWEGGLIGFLLLAMILRLVIQNYKNCRDNGVHNFFVIVLLGVFLECALEVFLSQSLTWIILVVIYYSLKIFEREKINEINFN